MLLQFYRDAAFFARGRLQKSDWVIKLCPLAKPKKISRMKGTEGETLPEYTMGGHESWHCLTCSHGIRWRKRLPHPLVALLAVHPHPKRSPLLAVLPVVLLHPKRSPQPAAQLAALATSSNFPSAPRTPGRTFQGTSLDRCFLEDAFRCTR
jgi:hypothetical protein